MCHTVADMHKTWKEQSPCSTSTYLSIASTQPHSRYKCHHAGNQAHCRIFQLLDPQLEFSSIMARPPMFPRKKTSRPKHCTDSDDGAAGLQKCPKSAFTDDIPASQPNLQHPADQTGEVRDLAEGSSKWQRLLNESTQWLGNQLIHTY
jgi:hypothetical protein